MELPTIWFIVIAVFWIGYFLLEGFDFGVGMLLGVLSRDDTERRVMINTIGPVWDGNEVWVIVAVAATFAAFPDWYATLLSAFYFPLLLIIVALILRGLAFEYRAKRDHPRWKARWDTAIIAGSTIPAFTWGLIFATILTGLPLDANGNHTGGLTDILTPYAISGGLATLSLFATHGANFLTLRTTDTLRHRAHTLAGRLGIAATGLTAIFLTATLTQRFDATAAGTAALAIAALATGLIANRHGKELLAFTGTATAIIATAATIFIDLYPNVLPSTAHPATSLTIHNAAATPYTLGIMTWTAAILTPVVLCYQAWTYWVFRKRISVGHIPTP